MDYDILHNNNESNELYDFIDSSINGTIFHHPKFLSYHGNKFQDVNHFVFSEKNKIVGFIPGVIQESKFYSHPGASFGGFVTSNLKYYKYKMMINLFIGYLKSIGIKEINITPTPYVYGSNDYTTYIYFSNGFVINNYELLSVVDVQNELFSKDMITNRDRNRIKKSKLKLIINNNSNELYHIILKNHEKYNAKPTHTKDELSKISKLFPNRIFQFSAYLDDTPIGVVVVIVCNNNVVYTFYISNLSEYNKYRAIVFLLGNVLLWAKDNKYKYVDLGSSTGVPNQDSLILFKENFGSRGIMKYFYKYEG